MITEEQIKNQLKTIKYPGYSRDIVSFGLVRGVQISNGNVQVHLQLSTRNPEVARKIEEDVRQTLQQLDGIKTVEVHIQQPQPTAEPRNPDPWSRRRQIPGVKHVVAIASGKGGVGKSTVAVNLASALAQLGERTGLLDCDVYGPSVPLMMGIHERPGVTPSDKLLPLEAHGVKLMSIGFLIDPEQPVIWRGPLLAKAVEQFLFGVDWGELDYLVVDLPPGTGDAPLSLCQLVPLDGGVMVTTPQEASLGVVRKGIGMFQRVEVPVLGLVENMSYFIAPDGSRVEIFGHGGGRAEAERQGLRFLGEIPIFVEIREAGDRGIPIVVAQPDSEPARCFLHIAQEVQKAVAELKEKSSK